MTGIGIGSRTESGTLNCGLVELKRSPQIGQRHTGERCLDVWFAGHHVLTCTIEVFLGEPVCHLGQCLRRRDDNRNRDDCPLQENLAKIACVIRQTRVKSLQPGQELTLELARDERATGGI
jgi:hypothetical protein